MRFVILVYPGTEPIDLATCGVLSMARRLEPSIRFWTVARHAGPVELASGLVVMAAHGYADCPPFDVLVVLGGPGWRDAARDESTLAFLRAAPAGALVCSVCTGAMILAAAGMLEGLSATTKVEVVPPEVAPLAELARGHPAVATLKASLVDNGRIITGGGVTLCIDTMLHLLGRCYNAGLAREVARTMEYRRAWNANRSELPPVEQAP